MKRILTLVLLLSAGLTSFGQRNSDPGKNGNKNQDNQNLNITPDASGVKRSIGYRFSSGLNDADPGAGIFRFNTDDVSKVSYILVDDVDVSGDDQTKWYSTWDKTTGATGRGRITLVEKDGKNIDVFDVSGLFMDASGYWKVPVEYVSGKLPSDGAVYYYIFERIENKKDKNEPAPASPVAVVTPAIVTPQPEPAPVPQPEPVPVQPAPAPQPEPVPVQPAPAPVQPAPAPQPEPVEVQPAPTPVQPAVSPVQPAPTPAPVVIQPESPVPAQQPLPVVQPEPAVVQPVQAPQPLPVVQPEPAVVQPAPAPAPAPAPEPVLPVAVVNAPSASTPQPEPVIVQPVPIPVPQPEQVPAQPAPAPKTEPVQVTLATAPKPEPAVTQPVPAPQPAPVTATSSPSAPGRRTAPNQNNREPLDETSVTRPIRTSTTSRTSQPPSSVPSVTSTPAATQPATTGSPSGAAKQTNVTPQPAPASRQPAPVPQQSAPPAKPSPAPSKPQPAPSAPTATVNQPPTGPRTTSSAWVSQSSANPPRENTGTSLPTYQNPYGSGRSRGKWYHGIIELGYGAGTSDYGINNFRFNFINGIHITPTFSAGLGLGYRYYFTERYADRGLISGKVQFPVFLDLRKTFSTRTVTPYLAFGIGNAARYSSATDSTNAVKEGLFLSPSGGIWFNLSPRFAIFGGLAYEVQKMEYVRYSDNGHYKRNTSSISINIGISF